MDNKEIRRLYIEQISQIAEKDVEWMRDGLSAEDRARRCWRIPAVTTPENILKHLKSSASGDPVAVDV